MQAAADVARVLVVTAHPDDVDFGAGGTVAGWTRDGIDVSYCIVTDGDAGGFDPDVPRSEIPGIRRAEQRSAAAVLGVEDVTFLGYRDGALEVTLELRRDIARQIRRTRPGRVLLQTPERNWDRLYPSHPDHMAAGAAAMAAVYPDSRNAFAFPELYQEGYEPHTVREVWVMGTPAPNHVVDVTDLFPTKIEALRAHASQVDADTERRVKGWLAAAAREHGLEPGRLAEVFRVVATV